MGQSLTDVRNQVATMNTIKTRNKLTRAQGKTQINRIRRKAKQIQKHRRCICYKHKKEQSYHKIKHDTIETERASNKVRSLGQGETFEITYNLFNRDRLPQFVSGAYEAAK